jgi:dihydrofolate synthase/folylpolyglutamate synthase
MSAPKQHHTPPEASAEVERILALHPQRGRRESLEAVGALRTQLGLAEPIPAVVVVGTNGKTSVATYLQRLLSASGVHAGLYTSPHLSSWSERIQVDGRCCDPGELARTLTAVHEQAEAIGRGREEIRFFDLLTLAAELIFRRAGVSAAVFEAGIGGRYDAVRLLSPRLVLLTSIARDHVEMLGESLADILTEKLLVAPPGAVVLSWPLDELRPTAEEIAAAAGFTPIWLEPGADADLVGSLPLPDYLRRALALALAGWRCLGEGLGGKNPPLDAIEVTMPGRFEGGRRDGVPYLLDAAHNEAAWAELGEELERSGGSGPLIAVFSVSPGKDREGLPAALGSLPGLDGVIVTRHTALPAADPELVASELLRAGVEAVAVEDVATAARRAFDRAAGDGGRVVFFGSTHLVGEVRALLSSGDDPPR